jgi:hypothetical protein
MIHDTLTIILTHQNSEAVSAMLRYWSALDAEQDFLIVNGGPHDLQKALDYPVVVVNDPALRTRDHGREKQSYQGVFRAVAQTVKASRAQFVSFVEYDEVPVDSELNRRMKLHLEAEQADVLGLRLFRVDQTSHHQYLDHCRDVEFLKYWRDISCREDKQVVLSMLGCGTFWRREAFLAVAALKPTTRIYLEMFLPTAAHHLGYRVRPFPAEQENSMEPEVVKFARALDVWKSRGAWRVHPLKEMWVG